MEVGELNKKGGKNEKKTKQNKTILAKMREHTIIPRFRRVVRS